MGAWSVHTFGNDTACDWTPDAERAEDLSLVRETLSQISECGDDDLDSDDLESCALAAWTLGQHALALSLLERAIDAGTPRTWIRDSALYDEWRQDPEFAAVLGDGAR